VKKIVSNNKAAEYTIVEALLDPVVEVALLGPVVEVAPVVADFVVEVVAPVVDVVVL